HGRASWGAAWIIVMSSQRRMALGRACLAKVWDTLVPSDEIATDPSGWGPVSPGDPRVGLGLEPREEEPAVPGVRIGDPDWAGVLVRARGGRGAFGYANHAPSGARLCQVACGVASRRPPHGGGRSDCAGG